MKRKTVAFFPTHPSQIWMMRPIAEYVNAFAETIWILRDKDIARPLADGLGLNYISVSKASRGFIGNGLELIANIARCRRLTRSHKIDLWITKYGAGNIGAILGGARSLAFNDDDVDIVPLIAWTSYPFASVVVVPDVVRMGSFSKKALTYPGCHELFYLHPSRFTGNKSVLKMLNIGSNEKFALVRLSALQAHHDAGIRGVSFDVVRRVIKLTEGRLKVFITSEKHLPKDFEHLRLPIPPQHIHDALACAEFLFGDSQSMTAEAAVLGVPSFRLSSFAGRISSISEFEKYGLSYSAKPEKANELLMQLTSVLNMENRKEEFARRRQTFIKRKIDPVPFFADVIKMVLEHDNLNKNN